MLLVWLAVLSVACWSDPAACTLPPDTELCVDHPGSDLKEFSPSAANMSLCYQACDADSECVGWVYMPPNCTFGHLAPGKPFCWLKSQWSGERKRTDCCRDSGLVRATPPHPHDRPTVYDPFPTCSSAASVEVLVDPTNITHAVNPLYRGCHLDLGFSHQPQALYSQMVYSASFELGDPTHAWDPKGNPDGVGWVPYIQDSTVKGTMTFDSTTQFMNHSTLSLTKAAGSSSSVYGVANRGLGHEGLVFEAGQPYEGYVVVQSSKAVSISVQLVDRSVEPAKVLASQELQLASRGWSRLPFTLTPDGGTDCVGLEPGSDPTVGCPVFNNTYSPNARMSDLTAHICVKCGGEFVVGALNGSFSLGFSFLQPGPWGRLGNLSVLASGADLLKKMGITAIRQGGSFAKSEDYFWKHWIPRHPEDMPSVVWGKDIETGWGPFHLIDMCNQLGIEPVVTTFAVPVEPEDMADFVEYTYGNASTKWGNVRIENGHPEPYRWRFVELGNEQYNYLYVDQVQAMEERATALGMAKFFYYMFPSNGGVNSTDQVRAKSLGLGDHLVVDIHDGATGGVARTRDLLQKYPSWGAVNAETNCNDHTVHRMLEEAQDLLSFFSANISQLHFRAGSFCVERSGYQEGGLNDQGISFYLPNMTWLQPPGQVHGMISDAFLGNAAASAVTGCGAACGATPCATAHAQVASDGSHTSVFLLNMTPEKLAVTLKFPTSWVPKVDLVPAVQIQSSNLQLANTPASPDGVGPRTLSYNIQEAFSVPGQSLTVLDIAGAKL